MTKQSKNLIDIISKYKIKISDKEFDTKINILENIRKFFNPDIKKSDFDMLKDEIEYLDQKIQYERGLEQGLNIAREVLLKNKVLGDEQLKKELIFKLKQVNFMDKSRPI